MNIFTEQSIELANQWDYLDQLFRIYPLLPSLFSLQFNYLNSFSDSSYDLGISRNVNMLSANIQNDYDDFVRQTNMEKLTVFLFNKWIEKGVLGISPSEVDDFNSSDKNGILKGSSPFLTQYAGDYLDLKIEGSIEIDFIGRFNRQYILGIVKVISDTGKEQYDKFLTTMSYLQLPVNNNVRIIAILDGILYQKRGGKMYDQITTRNVDVVSALILNEYLYSL